MTPYQQGNKSQVTVSSSSSSHPGVWLVAELEVSELVCASVRRIALHVNTATTTGKLIFGAKREAGLGTGEEGGKCGAYRPWWVCKRPPTSVLSPQERGHGTYMEKGVQVASVAGCVTRVNRLITVTPLRQVYQGAVGDTVVGRITRVQNNRWKVDVNSRLDAELRLSNIQLPGGEQRRCSVEDERDMRALLTEGDLVCVEVQKICDDGLLRLAARSNKFGKVSDLHGQGSLARYITQQIQCLTASTLVAVSPSLIAQDKQRMHDLPCGARVVFGANGYVYITPTVPQEQASTYIVNFEEVPVEVRKTIGRLRNCLKLLAHHSIMISPTSVMTAYDTSIELEFEVRDLLKLDVMQDVALAAVQSMNK
ncbi:Exosome complex component RRP4 [Chionoecetes opilio]|uniref:Exosome complex component RRP4 n=1 Tax=Chionoecetes opilio TaxID=41210 RepID=A0A8J5CU13_CHIOP|nr:Exosome complex component RRP4 [Chionoecetes opilio]